MPSQIISIFQALASWEFAISGETIYAPVLQQLEDMPASPNLPMRILSPALNRSEGELAGLTINNSSYLVGWTIDDLLLWRPVTQTVSFSDEVVPLMQYMVAYAEKWVSNRQITAQAFIEEVTDFSAGVFEYPQKSQVYYYGVLATLHIKEIVTNE